MATPFTTWLNYREVGPDLEINDQPSLTQPDEVLSLRQMLERHARGLPVHVSDQGVYLPESLGYIPDPKSLDLTELHELRDHFAEQQKQIKKALDDREKSPSKHPTSGEADKPQTSEGKPDSEEDSAS